MYFRHSCNGHENNAVGCFQSKHFGTGKEVPLEGDCSRQGEKRRMGSVPCNGVGDGPVLLQLRHLLHVQLGVHRGVAVLVVGLAQLGVPVLAQNELHYTKETTDETLRMLRLGSCRLRARHAMFPFVTTNIIICISQPIL